MLSFGEVNDLNNKIHHKYIIECRATGTPHTSTKVKAESGAMEE
jgi:hypothetical protein